MQEDKKEKINEFSSFSQFRVFYSDFTNIKELSILEAYGTILSGFYPLRNKKVTIKVLPHECFLEKYAKYHIREVKILASLDDFFLLHFVGFFLEKSLVVIAELIEKGDLFMRLFKKSKITPEHLSIVAIGVVKGMMKFNSLGYLHEDLKSPNILLDNDFLHCIFDYGYVCE